MHVDTVVTHPDWVAAWGNWGPVGVQRIIDACRSANIRRIYWRTSCGARVFYWSHLEEIYKGEAHEACEVPDYWKVTLAGCDYREWDQMPDAVACAAEAGIDLWVWYSVYEESHLQSCLTRFAQEHPEFWWTCRTEERRPSKLSFAFPEVHRHKLALIREMMDYKPKGLLLDYVRQLPLIGESCPPQVDPAGVCQYGYEEPAIRSYVERYGTDPRKISNDTETWLLHRADYLTRFMRELREERQRSGYRYPVAAMIQPPSALSKCLPDWPRYVNDQLVAEDSEWKVETDPLRGALVDWQTWIDEKLIDELHIMIPEWNLACLDPGRVSATIGLMKELVGGKCPVAAGIYCYNMEQLGLEMGAARLDAAARAAQESGADALVLWESTAIESWGGWDKYLPSGLWKTVSKLSVSEPQSVPPDKDGFTVTGTTLTQRVE